MSEILENAPEMEAQQEQAAVENAPVAEELPTIEEPIKAEVSAPKKMREFENPYAEMMQNFDWSSMDTKGSKYSKSDSDRYEELYTKSFKSIDEQAVIIGTVVSFNSREIVVNIGFKSDGVISASELRYNPNLKIGDEIEVEVLEFDGEHKRITLSRKSLLQRPETQPAQTEETTDEE